MYLQLLLLTLVATLASGWVWHPLTWPMIYPLVTGALVGIVLGDPVTGMLAGVYINLLYLCWVTAGGAMPGNIMFAGVFGTALTIVVGANPVAAPVFAIPLTFLGLFVWRLQMTLNSVWVDYVAKLAAKGKDKAVEITAYILPQIIVFFIQLIPAILLLYWAETLKTIFSTIPDTIWNIIYVAGEMLPLVGIAMMFNYLFALKLTPLFFIGYFAVKLLGFNLQTIALFGLLIAVYIFLNRYDSDLGSRFKIEVKERSYNKQLRRSDLIKHWLRGYSQEACYNYKSLQAVGACAAIIPVLRKLYHDDKDSFTDALNRYLAFFNTEPGFIGPCIAGVAASLEEDRANGILPMETDINLIRSGSMGPLAGLGDSISSATIYPVLISVSIAISLDGNIIGPFVFMLIFGALMLYIGYKTYMLGYNYSKAAVPTILKSTFVKMVIDQVKPLSFLVLGALSAEVLSFRISCDAISGFLIFGQKVNFALIVSTILPIAAVLLVLYIIRKMIPVYLVISGIIIIAILGAQLGLLNPGFKYL